MSAPRQGPVAPAGASDERVSGARAPAAGSRLITLEGLRLDYSVLLAHAARVAQSLPATATRVVNLCERRDYFLYGFCGALLTRRTTVLPPSRAPQVVRDTIELAGAATTLDDADVARALAARAPDEGTGDIDGLPDDFLAAIGFTSGSTGMPAAHPKRWAAFRASARLNAASIRAALTEHALAGTPAIVATVPPQHMYGMELSVLQPLLSGMTVHAARPLLPADVADTLRQVAPPRVLVTTPVHLRALVGSHQPFPETAVVVSATAPLAADLARAVEGAFDATVVEMFGSTETCVIAARRTARETAWNRYPGVELEPAEDHTVVHAPWFDAATTIQDVIERLPDGRFALVGRSADMIEIAGKRASLADLTKRLLSVTGVQDAAVFVPEPRPGAVTRVAALVVAPGRDARALRAELAERVDVAFLPRPLLLVSEVPRNETGKVPRERLLAVLATRSKGSGARGW